MPTSLFSTQFHSFLKNFPQPFVPVPVLSRPSCVMYLDSPTSSDCK